MKKNIVKIKRRENIKRITNIRKSLKAMGLSHYMAAYLKMYPQDDTSASINRVRNVISGLIPTDVTTIKKLERFIESLQKVA